MTAVTAARGQATRPVARFVGIGLLLMAIFTVAWALWSVVGLPVGIGIMAVLVLGSLAIRYLINGAQLIRSAVDLPAVGQGEMAGRGRTLQIGFGVIVGIEGLVIGVVASLLGANGADNYLQPAIALVVGLHFIPFAFLFRRTVDFYVAGWVVAWATVGIWLISSQQAPAVVAGAAVALATACGTAAYGIYLLRIKKLLLAERIDPSTHSPGA